MYVSYVVHLYNITQIPAGSLPGQTIVRLFEQVLVVSTDMHMICNSFFKYTNVVCQALQKHGVHEGNRVALTSLAQLMYETLVCI